MPKSLVKQIAREITGMAERLDTDRMHAAVRKILSAKQVFVAGAGRSGDLMKCMAKRLMHAEIQAYVLGETITPPAGRGDVLVIGSGSGETESLVVLSGKAKRLGVEIVLITTNEASAIANQANLVLVIPAKTPKAVHAGTAGINSAQPMANLFEQMLLLTGDAICMEVALQKGLSAEDMFANHANLE